MSRNRTTRSGAQSQRDPNRSKSQTASKGATAKSSAASRRYAERHAQKQQAALEARRARNRRIGLVSIALVVILIAVLVVVKVAGNGNSTADVASPPRGTPIPAATLSKLASVPLSTLAAAPTSGLLNQIQSTTGATRTSNGKPDLLYIGAEYCPHCAAERWALYVALSKFGTFSPDPGKIHSATRDGNVPTLTFYGTTYTSSYLSFTPVEVFTNKPSGNSYTTLQVPTKAQNDVWQSTGQGTFPFLDFAGKAALIGAQYSYVPMQNLPFSAVASQVGDNSTEIGSNIDAGAYQLIKSMCHTLSSGQPASVCSGL